MGAALVSCSNLGRGQPLPPRVPLAAGGCVVKPLTAPVCDVPGVRCCSWNLNMCPGPRTIPLGDAWWRQGAFSVLLPSTARCRQGVAG